MYKCLHGSAPAYLTDELCQVADVEARQRLCSSSSSSLIVSRIRLLTVGDRAFPVATARVWNSLPDLVTSGPSVAVFRSRLKTHLFNISYPVIVQCLRSDFSCFGHYNRSCLLTYWRMMNETVLYRCVLVHSCVFACQQTSRLLRLNCRLTTLTLDWSSVENVMLSLFSCTTPSKSLVTGTPPTPLHARNARCPCPNLHKSYTVAVTFDVNHIILLCIKRS